MIEPTPQRAPWWVLLVLALVIAAGVAVLKLPPLSFLTRDDLTACADVDCLLAAQAEGTGAELKLTEHTVEGDPISTYYRVTPGRSGVELFIDSRDGFGKEGWTHLHCPGAVVVPDPGTCRDA